MAFEVDSVGATCSKCGKAYGRRKGNFSVSYSEQHRGIGYLPVCKNCVDNMYITYLSQCKNNRDAVRQMCRKLDIYWSETEFDKVMRTNTSRTVMTNYIQKVNSVKYAGKCYDSTLAEEGTLWTFGGVEEPEAAIKAEGVEDGSKEKMEVSEDIIAFWGPGFTPDMYFDLEQRRDYWMASFPKDIEIDIGTEALIRQICNLEIDINRDRAAGKSIEKSVNTLNNLLGSASLKPAQKKDDSDANLEGTPFGVWIRRWEDKRPVPDIDPELEDVDGIVRYITIWFLGHLCKMLGIKNTYCKLYEDEIKKLRVERPEFDDEDDEALFDDIFGYSDEDNI